MIDGVLKNILRVGANPLWLMRREGVHMLAAAEPRERDAVLRSGEPLSRQSFATIRDGTAIIPVRGPLVARYTIWQWSFEEIETDLDLALRDDRVERIMLDVDSPGGMVTGCAECAKAIRRAADVKPLAAHVSGLGASAAYWLSAAAPSLTASRSAVIGSVGVIIRYTDLIGILERLGATHVEIMATQSPKKSFPSGSEEEREQYQPLVDDVADEFLTAVAAFRGVDRDAAQERFGEGAVFTGPEARERGMIDNVITLEEALAELADRRMEPQGPEAAAAPAVLQEKTMDWKDVDAAGLSANRPDLITAITEEAVKKAQTDAGAAAREAAEAAQKAERERITGLQKLAKGGFQKELAEAIEKGTSPEQFAMALVDRMHAQGGAYLDARKKSEEEGGAPNDAHAEDDPAETAEVKSGDPEAVAKAEWAKMSDEKRSAFIDEKNYVATRKAELAGRVRGSKAA